MKIAARLEPEIDEAVLGEQGQHVVEEADAGLELRLTGALPIEGKPDVGLAGLTMDLRGARHKAYLRS